MTYGKKAIFLLNVAVLAAISHAEKSIEHLALTNQQLRSSLPSRIQRFVNKLVKRLDKEYKGLPLFENSGFTKFRWYHRIKIKVD